jgi:tRNA threonylcarbamoyladenosine biosynthesis protein TsaB
VSRGSLLLAIDTSTAAGTVAVGEGSRVLAEALLAVQGRHSTALMPAIDAVVQWAGVARTDLTGVVVAGGPGSFTGLRIGAATAMGIGIATGVPVRSYSGLLAAATTCAIPRAGAPARVCALFDARRNDVFAACYNFALVDGETRVVEEFPPTAVAITELPALLGEGPAPIWTGDGAWMHADWLRSHAGGDFAPAHLATARASALLTANEWASELGRDVASSDWEPEYVRASGAERIVVAAAQP